MVFNLFKQQDQMDCGVACIQMILNFYSSSQPIHKLRSMTGTDREGASAYGIKKCLEKLGFNCLAVEADSSVWNHEELHLPAIAHVVIDQRYLHYVVIYQVDDLQVYIADPAKGKYSLNHSEFNKIWTNILLIPYPSETYKSKKEKIAGLSSYSSLLFKHKKNIISIAFISLIITLIALASSYYLKILIDKIIPYSNVNLLNIVTLGLSLIYIFQTFLTFTRTKLLAKFGQSISKSVLLSYINHVLSLPLSFFYNRQVGEIISRFLDASKVIDALASSAVSIIIDLSMFLIIGGFLFTQNKLLFLMCLIPLPFYILIVSFFYKRNEGANEKEMSSSTKINNSIIETLNGMETIKSLNSPEFFYDKLVKEFNFYIEKSFKRIQIENWQEVLKKLLHIMGSTLLLWLGSYLVIDKKISVGQLVTYNALMMNFIQPIENIINLQAKIQTAQVASKRMNEVLSTKIEMNKNDNVQYLTKIDQIEVKNLSFTYNLKKTVLENISITIDQNKSYALVGSSGSGKSTFAKLLVKFYEPDQGEILINNHSINNYSYSSLREKIIYVNQEPFFFKGTLKENLTLGLEKKPNNHIIWNILEIVEMKDYFSNLSLGLNTYLEEGGNNLSVGQKQRLSIARVLLRDCDIIILDEATSALDPITEKKVIDNLINMKNVGLIFITHNLRIAKKCDKILVLDQYNLCEAGSHDYLLSCQEVYANLWKGYIG
ncbi:peptidase domain-containing ABC transporter [Facklamia sp. 7083-14-GEN3]|uniref:peptidase domain-containing ABC transporter n=1 Tax=Facklamia sp. 7083-14-GEN3 TaxID=2973478 RepID=UPI00215CA165|nr:peptide cleavage/export ABC transporter [Facklamia sp. 7083-14-GEN3]MCR8969739.1 peptide cleavage/export ABC transporter [Facklamia sp. 7083-14-GEN3]